MSRLAVPVHKDAGGLRALGSDCEAAELEAMAIDEIASLQDELTVSRGEGWGGER